MGTRPVPGFVLLQLARQMDAIDTQDMSHSREHRLPYADASLHRVVDGVSAEQPVLLSLSRSLGYAAVHIETQGQRESVEYVASDPQVWRRLEAAKPEMEIRRHRNVWGDGPCHIAITMG